MSLLLLFGGGGAGLPSTYDWDADWDTDGTLAVSVHDVHVWDGDWDLDGDLDIAVTPFIDWRAAWTLDGTLTATSPPVGADYRVILTDATGSTVAVLDQAVVGDIRWTLNGIESWSFTLPANDPKARWITDQAIREVMLWRGDQLLSWGPLGRPRVTTKTISAQPKGAGWHLTRRHVGKANRTNHLLNGSFEDGLAGWNFAKEAYFLSYDPVEAGDARIYSPGKDGSWALELNADPKPWTTPAGSIGSGSTVHVVVSGDTLWDLAITYYGSGTQWHRIYDANAALIQADAQAAGLWNPQDPGHWIFPGQNLTIPDVSASDAVTAPPDNAIIWGQVYAWQEIVVAGGARGCEVTMAGWIKIPSAQFQGWGVHRRGVMLERLPTDWRTNNSWTAGLGPNTNGGIRAFYTDVIEHTSSRLDEGHPLDGWIRHETTITVPPGATESIIARVEGIDGRAYFDKLTVTFDDALYYDDTDQATIIAGLVDHAQDPAYDKNDVNISVDAPPTGVNRDLLALHSEHANIWRLITAYCDLRDGVDLSWRYTPTDRILTVRPGGTGAERRGLHLMLGRNISEFDWVFDTEAAANAVIMLGTGNGSDREEYAAIDPTAFADGLICETVIATAPEVDLDLLPEIADETLAVTSRPEILRIDTLPHNPDSRPNRWIGWVQCGDIIPVTLRLLDANRQATFERIGDYRVVEMILHPATDTLTITLNPRPT